MGINWRFSRHSDVSLTGHPYSHIVTHIMKTTIDLPDDLLVEAKMLAVRRKTTLRAIVESALRREIRPSAAMENPDPEKYELGPLGFLVIKRHPGDNPVTSEMICAVQDEIDEEDFQKAMHPNGK